MAILAQSGRGFLNHTRFARDCRTFLEVCAQGAANEHFRREVRRFFCKGAETIVKYIEIVLPGLV